MNIMDMHHKTNAAKALATATITTGTANGIEVDMKGYDAVEFVILTGTIANDVGLLFTVTLMHDTVTGMGTATDVTAAETLGTGTFDNADDDVVKRIGYIGKKRFVRLKIVAVNAANGGPVTSVALLGAPKHLPVADNA